MFRLNLVLILSLLALSGCTTQPIQKGNPFFHGEWMSSKYSDSRLIVSDRKIISEYIDDSDLPYAPAVRRQDYDFEIHKILPLENGTEYLGFMYVYGSKTVNYKKDTGTWARIRLTKSSDNNKIQSTFLRCYDAKSREALHLITSLTWDEALKLVCQNSGTPLNNFIVRPPPPASKSEIIPAHIEDYFGTWRSVLYKNKMTISHDLIKIYRNAEIIESFEILKTQIFSDRIYYLTYRSFYDPKQVYRAAHGRFGLIRILRQSPDSSIVVEYTPCFYAAKEDYPIEGLMWSEAYPKVCLEDSLKYKRTIIFNERYRPTPSSGSQ